MLGVQTKFLKGHVFKTEMYIAFSLLTDLVLATVLTVPTDVLIFFCRQKVKGVVNVFIYLISCDL